MSFINKKKKSIAYVCDKGKVRDNNEDNLVVLDYYLPVEHDGTRIDSRKISFNESFSFGVFDGMGGEKAGELASFTAAKAFADLIDHNDISSNKLEQLLVEVNKRVFDESTKEKITQIGTTASVVVYNNGQLLIGNVGDSPIYLFRKGKLKLISELHTNKQWLKENDVNQKPVLTQFIGIDYNDMLIEPYVTSFEYKKNDQILVCSDGLTDMVSEEYISAVLNVNCDNDIKVKILLDEALKNGGKDNITILLL